MTTADSTSSTVPAKHPLNGIHAASLCPMDATGQVLIDELATHIDMITGTPGIRGLLVNGHAGEGGLLSALERQRVLDTVLANVPEDCHVCAGVAGESTAVAMDSAVDADRQGADSILVFPPNAWALGHDADMVVTHHRAIADACALPMVLYRAPLAAGKQSYSIATLQALMDIDTVTAIKKGSWEVSAYEEALRAVKARRPDVAVLGSGDEHLMTCYAIGSEGSQVSLAAIVPGLIVELFDAMGAGYLTTARQLHALVYPLSELIYRRAPPYKATARLKTCMRLLGRFPSDFVKLPLMSCDETELASLRSLLKNPDYERYLL